MKKIISIILAASLIMTLSVSAAYAQDTSSGASLSAVQTSFSDISGRDCEKAVSALVEKGIINGFSDGTFRPESSITRAQACTIISKAFPDLTSDNPASSSFADTDSSAWYADAVSYCASNHIIVGDGNGMFRPSASVSNYELITMLVRAAGLADDSVMSWPDDYVAAAEGIGMLSGVSLSLSSDGSLPASRGNASVMVCAAAGIDLNDTEPSVPSEPSEPSVPSDNSDFFAGKSGNAYGMITSSGHTLNENGENVGMIEFFMQGNTYTLLERSSSTGVIDSLESLNGLMRVNLSNGKIKSITPVSSLQNSPDKDLSDKSSYPFTITKSDGSSSTYFHKITKAGKTYAYYNDGDTETYAGINNPCVVYICNPDGSDITYELGSNSDITEDAYIAAFAVDKESAGVADIVLIIKSEDAGQLLDFTDASENTGILN